MTGQAGLISPPPHPYGMDRLLDYLSRHVEGFCGPATLRLFQGGQSNPTFLIESALKSYVLRRKPPGPLLPSAHRIDREYRIQGKLIESSVPVAKMIHWCGDSNIIGTEFYLMEYIPGRVFHDSAMPGASPMERGRIQQDMIRTLAALHRIAPEETGLADFGHGENYLARQIDRWTRQYESSKTEALPDMDRLMHWLRENVPTQDEASIVHGDFRVGNMIVHASQPRIVAVLDWELSTIGHPLADLAYFCMPYHMPPDEGSPYAGYVGLDRPALGLMGEDEILSKYCAFTGRDRIEHWKFFVGFALFRSAAIIEGVYSRSLAGNAADARANRMHSVTRLIAARGWQTVNRA